MPPPNINLAGAAIPTRDGEVNEYTYPEAQDAESYFDDSRKVVFVNGMLNSGKDHAESALALSWVQMCTVIGVYNKSTSGWVDFMQCIGDKNQFDGPVSLSAKNKVAVGKVLGGKTSVQAARDALSRNPAQVALFDLLRKQENARLEIFAHSQGNLILSNTLQAIAAVDGQVAITGRVIHTFGSPAVNWPLGITKYEHGFTWDPVSWLAGFDSTWTISKVGMPSGTNNPITHAFLEYLRADPAFVVNRFRWGGLGVTFSMDERGLAKCLIAMGTNMRRVRAIFEHLASDHPSDADDVAVIYVGEARKSGAITTALKTDRALVGLLIRQLEGGWSTAEEKKAVEFLKTL